MFLEERQEQRDKKEISKMRKEVRSNHQPGSSRLVARRVITVMLSIMMVFTMMPWIAPGVGQVNAANGKIATLLWPARDNKGNAVKSITEGRGFSDGHQGIDINSATKWYCAYSGTIDTVFKGCVSKNALHYGATKADLNHEKCSPTKNGKAGTRTHMVLYFDLK